MKRFQAQALLMVLACVSLVATACSGGGATAGSSTGGGTSPAAAKATTAPTVAAKPKPTAVPKITVAFCQDIMTVAQANQIMNPSIPATTIRVDSTSTGGSCNYEYKSFLSVVSIVFEPYTGGSGNEQTVLAAAASKMSQANNATITTTQVPGVGDAAMFITGVINVPQLHLASLDVIYGAVILSCANYKVQGSSFATQQTYLTQVCQQFISRL